MNAKVLLMNANILAVPLAAIAVVAIGTPALAQQELVQRPSCQGNQSSGNPAVFDPCRVGNMEPLKPIVEAPVIPAKQVVDQVYPEELVLGVVIGNQARAYPINMLTGPQREIINDQLGGRAIAATW